MAQHQPTQQKNQFSKSLGSGVKSVFGGSGRKYFVLEHRTHSSKHKAGKVQEIIVDYIELGRDPKCQVRFGDDMKTVSRRHASIAAQGEKWVIKNLSSTNQTLVNGRPVANEWFLQSGDEFQLSADGPKMGFIIPQNNTVGSLGLSKRLSLFRQQALRPFKTAITVLTIVLVVAIAGLSYGIWSANKETKEIVAEFDEFKELNQQELDSLRAANAENEELRTEMASKISDLEGTISRIRVNRGGGGPAYTPVSNEEFSNLYPGVYQIILVSLVLDFEGDVQEFEIEQPFGSGFQLNDGRFVTARHVAEPWLYASPDETDFLMLNALVELGGTLTANFRAVSPAGTSFTFTNHDVTVDASQDEYAYFVDEDGERLTVKVAPLGPTDWARLNTSQGGGLAFDAERSRNLTIRTQLEVLGYPLGLAARSGSNISPIYGSCVVGADGLQNGVIMVSDRNFEHGNSGGPVFVEVDGKFIVIGIISAGEGDGIGYIVPIGVVR